MLVKHKITFIIDNRKIWAEFSALLNGEIFYGK